MSEINRSITLGTNEDHGMDFSENTGYWPMPETCGNVIKILDEDNYPHVLVLDYKDGCFYDITTRDGPSGSNLNILFTDKAAVDGTGGYDIEPEVLFKEDTGEFENYTTEHLSSRFGLRPYKETYRDQTGYDSNGFPTDIEFTTKIFKDGEPTTETVLAEDISKSGEIVYDRKVEGHRLQTEFSANKSGFRLVNRKQTYITKDINENPDNRLTTENTYQNTLSSPILWVTRGENYNYDRITGTEITGTYTQTTGPDGIVNTALISTSVTFSNITNSNNKTLMFFVYGAEPPTVTIGGNNVNVTLYSNYNGWRLYYATNVTYTGSLIISNATPIYLYDIRVYTTDVSSAMRYYYNDVIDNKANNVCPLF